MSLWQKYKKTPLLTKLLVAMILGIALALAAAWIMRRIPILRRIL